MVQTKMYCESAWGNLTIESILYEGAVFIIHLRSRIEGI
jgi:hypothetical protein